MKKILALALALAICLCSNNVAFAATAKSNTNNTVSSVEQSDSRARTMITNFNLVGNPGKTAERTVNLSGYSSYTFDFRYLGSDAAGDAMTVDMKKPNVGRQTVATLSSAYKTKSVTSYGSGNYTVYAKNWESSSGMNTVFVIIYGN